MSNPNFPDGPYTTVRALKETINDTDVRKKIKRISVGTGVLVVVSGACVFHRSKIKELIAMHGQAVEWTMDNSFNEGVKYGLKLAKDIGLGAAEKSEYAFQAFDNAQDKAAWMHTTAAG